MAENRAPLPGAVNGLRRQTRQLAGRLDLERQARAYLQGLPGEARIEDVARAAARTEALESVLKPPQAVLRYVGGVL